MKRSLGARIEAANTALIADGRLGAVAEFFASDYVAHRTKRNIAGHDGVRRFVSAIRRAFPDVQVEVEILVERKDRVAWQRTLRGIQRGAYQGFPASGRHTAWRDMVVSRFHDGMITEDWAISELAEQLLRVRKRA